MRTIGFALAIVFMTLLSLPSNAQVDCRNGSYCPAGNVCLSGGLCAVQLDKPIGAIDAPNGTFCEPGYTVSSMGNCLPPGYSQCSNGNGCPPGATCRPGGGCDGGPPQTGPMCNGVRCTEGRLCAHGKCYNPRYVKACDAPTFCTVSSVCTDSVATGCAYVEPARTQQIPYRR